MSDPEQKTAFEREAAKMLTSFEDGLERENYLRAVSARFDIPEDGLRRLVSGIGRGAGIRREDTLARRAEERENAKRRRADSGLKRSQRILLAWLAEEPALYGKIQDLISVSDFTEDSEGYRIPADGKGQTELLRKV